MTKTLNTLVLMAFMAILLGACDANIPSEALLTPDNSVTVADFTTSEAAVTYGQSVLLSWDLEIEDGSKIDFITIEPGVGQSTAASGSKQVTPTETTTYTLTAFVNNEDVASRSLTITVLTADGDEVVETPDAEDCTDGEDNDLDGKADCDDTDCDESVNCEEPIIEYSMVTAYKPVGGVEGDTIYIGDLVDVSWVSNYRYVTVSTDSTTTTYEGDFFGATSSIVVTAAAENKFTINAFDSDAQFVESFDVSFTAIERPVEEDHSIFEAKIYTRVNPATVLWGEPFTFTYSASLATHVYLKYGTRDYAEVSETGASMEFDLEDYSADGSIEFTLYAVDQWGNSNEATPTKVKVTPVQMNNGSNSVMSGITKMVYTYNQGEYYFVNKSKIWHSIDYGKTIEPVTVSGVLGDFTTVATDKDGVIYLAAAKSVTTESPDGTGGGLYFSTDKTTFTKMADGTLINVIYPRDVNTVYVGTDKIWFKVYASTDEKCDSGSVKTGGYCVDWAAFDGREGGSSQDWNDESEQINFADIYVKQASNNSALLMANGSTYLTTNGGDNFHVINSSLSGVFWESSRSAFAWNTDTSSAYTYSSSAEEFTLMPIQSLYYDIENIYYVTELGGHNFVATKDGIFYSTGDGWASLDVTYDDGDPVVYLIGQTVKIEKDSEDAVAHTLKGGYTHTLRGITASGKVYVMEWSAAAALRQKSNLEFLGTFDR